MKKRKSHIWDEHSIRAELHRRRMTTEHLARHKGVHRNTLSRALKTGTGKGAKIISDFLCISLDELWPHRRRVSAHVVYDSDKHGPSASQKKRRPTEIMISDSEVAA